MTALAGVGASVAEASTNFTNASKWTLSLKGATKDATPLGAAGAWTINIATLKSWTGKISAFLDTSDTAQTNLLALLNSTVSLSLHVDGGSHNFSGSAILTGIDPTVDVQSVETIDFSFTGTGACIYA